MTTKLLTILFAGTITIALAGCGNQSEQAKNEAAPGDQAATSEAAPGTYQDAAAPGAMAMAEGSKVSVTGTTGCAHCNFAIGTECASAVKTASGEIIILDGVAADSELMKDREAAKSIQLTGTVVASHDGQKHVKIESYQLN